MGSKEIATRVEKEHPEPPLPLGSPILEGLSRIEYDIMQPLRGIWQSGTYTNVLPQRSKDYFVKTREERLFLLQQAKESGEEAWIEASPAIKEVGDILKANGGPFVMGEKRG